MIKKDFQKIIADGEVFVIAEIGKGFIQTKEDQSVENYLKNAKELVDAALETGVQAVKFQTHEYEDEQMNIDVTSPHFKGSDRYSWVKRNTNAASIEFWKELKEYTESRGLIFFSTPMSRKSAEKLQSLDVPLWKVGSGDVEDHVMLDFLIETKKPIIISTGMVSLSQLDEVVNYITSKGSPLTVLYCVSEYPCPSEKFNLSTIKYLKEKYPNLTIGFSDHSVGDNTVPLAAVALGAQVIEKHFSLSRDFWGSDHKVSMTPDEMKDFVDSIKTGTYKNIDVVPFLGNKDRELEGATNQFRPYFNKSLVFGRDIKAGETITRDMVFAMRPRMYIDGLHANKLHDVLGKKAKKDFKKYDGIKSDSVE